jgi:hypothetical protein
LLGSEFGNPTDAYTNNASTLEQDTAPLLYADKRLSEFYSSYDEPELNAQETVDWLVQHKYISSDASGHPDPLEVLLHPEYIYRDRTPLSDIDWSHQPQYDEFKTWMEGYIEEERRLGNPDAFPPTYGPGKA